MAASVFCLAASLAKSRDRLFTFAFFLSALGLVYIMEHMLMDYLGSYDYHPGISSDQQVENALGNVFSQLSITATAMLLIVLDLSLLWDIVFALGYFAVETLFVRLGIYSHNWYRAWFTPVLLVPLFRFMRMWHAKAAECPGGWLRHAGLFLAAGAAFMHLVTFPAWILGVQWMHSGIRANASADHKSTNFFYIVILVNVIILICRMKSRRVLKAAAFGALLAALYALRLAGVLNVREGWFLPVALVNILVCYGLVRVLDSWLGRKCTALRR
jgi:hypothetical protein